MKVGTFLKLISFFIVRLFSHPYIPLKCLNLLHSKKEIQQRHGIEILKNVKCSHVLKIIRNNLTRSLF